MKTNVFIILAESFRMGYCIRIHSQFHWRIRNRIHILVRLCNHNRFHLCIHNHNRNLHQNHCLLHLG
ncbi:hypothetical protein [uncultured Bacteroides sp.]|uniref:hypothetical protein n=1 Tax=uncultured Bacteroides sp. TaxID=162156 RepID=UPI0023D1522F|nr:hypothetical protein [uncultured Bacteroides sp.]MDE5760535.1 hypothetical protein [Bacteroides sp.]